MKTFLLVVMSLLITIRSHAQFNDMVFYYQDGKPYVRACTSIVDINNDFDKAGRIKTISPICWDSVRYDCFIVIGFKLFTDQPLWVFTNSSEDIKQLTRTFDYDAYLKSYEFEHDLKQHISKKTLTGVFILETLGPPNKQVKSEGRPDSLERWYYDDLRVILTLKNGFVLSYDKTF